MLDAIAHGLKPKLPAGLIDELLAAYCEAKENFYSGGLRLSAVEGGRFCEAALRILQFITSGSFTDLNRQIDADRVMTALKDIPAANQPASIRLHIPRAIRVVYDVRNSRDNAHLADGIDPNLQDATLVIGMLDWVTAEFIRLYHDVSADRARSIIETLVVRKAPVVQDFNGFKKVLNPKLQAGQFVLVLLYECGDAGASYDQLSSWAKPTMRKNLARTLDQLVNDRAFVHEAVGKYILTRSGIAEVEQKQLLGKSF